jgi:SOS-response transcriptional repressor LexA
MSMHEFSRAYPQKPPTERQLLALTLVGEAARQGKPPPTLQEIGRAMGIRSTNGVAEHLRRLQRHGLLRRIPLKSRGLELTIEGRELLGLAPSCADQAEGEIIRSMLGLPSEASALAVVQALADALTPAPLDGAGKTPQH